MNKKELRANIDAYLETLDNESKNEWYCTDRENQSCSLLEFFEWMYAEEISKEERRKQYLELKAEFEGEQS